MPLITSTTYHPLWVFKSAHLNTIFPALFRKVEEVKYERERIDTPDGDFLDLDWSRKGGEKLLLVLHGLEGNAQKSYVKGMIRQFNRQGWDGVAINFRSCSGEMNRKLRVYHSGETGDLEVVIKHILKGGAYTELTTIGFSMGGNILLKYLGEKEEKLPRELKKAVAFSAPCDLASSSRALNQNKLNRIYLGRFMRALNGKLKQKMAQFPNKLTLPENRLPKNFKEFDGWFTAPIHGFKSAEDYWARASSKPFLSRIKIPTLLVNAQDDSFLGSECFPTEVAATHPFLHFESPTHGGHVGFTQWGTNGVYWSEQRAWDFVHNR